MSCPQSELEFAHYYYNLIHRQMEQPADDWHAVMSREYFWNGTMMRIPKGVGPGVQLPSDAPFYGLTQQWREGDGPVGRLYLPSPHPDNNNFYTRQIQYIRRVNPDGVTPTHVWTWEYKDGNEYAPICEGETPVPPSDLEKRVAALETSYADLDRRVTTLEQSHGNYPRKIALRNLANGKIVAAEITQTGWLRANRDTVGPWEQFELVPLD
jgi:hypothetical protein